MSEDAKAVVRLVCVVAELAAPIGGITFELLGEWQAASNCWLAAFLALAIPKTFLGARS